MSHAKDFGLESRDETLTRQLIFDYRESDLPPDDRALCDFAVKLTLTPGGMGDADVDRLRSHGFGDEAITVAVQVIGYFNYINRVADALGVDDETWFDITRQEWLSDKGKNYSLERD